jgi:hypothetical protein
LIVDINPGAAATSTMAASHSDSLAKRFASKCERLQGSVDFSKNALSDMYKQQLARDAKVVEALKEDVATLQRALSRLDADVGPQLDRIGLNARQQLQQPPKAVLVKAPTAAEQAAATLVQQRWRRRRPRIMKGTYHCPANLRRRFVEGVYESGQYYSAAKYTPTAASSAAFIRPSCVA